MAASKAGLRVDRSWLVTLLRTLAGIVLKPRSARYQITFSAAALTLGTMARGRRGDGDRRPAGLVPVHSTVVQLCD